MLHRLDIETREFHAPVDERWLDLLAAGVTRETYTRHLECVYGFEAPLESALAYTPHLVIADRLDRTRSGLIAHDLLALGVTPAEITALEQCEAVPRFSGPAEAMGWKYVADRPTLLHAAIKRNLLDKLDVTDAYAYLSAHDGRASARWHQLGTLLDDIAVRRRAHDEIVDAARAAFACMAAWYARAYATGAGV